MKSEAEIMEILEKYNLLDSEDYVTVTVGNFPRYIKAMDEINEVK